MQTNNGDLKAVVDDLRAQGLSCRAIARQIGSNYSAVRRLALAIQTSGTPVVHPSAPRLANIEQRLAVVEAFIAAFKRQTPPRSGAPNAAPECTLKRGFVIAADLSRQIDAHAETQHLQVKQILDTALREYFARRGWPPAGGKR
jgi:hypothetical protein